MGCGWYRDAYYPPEALHRPALGRRPRRRAGRARSTTGWGTAGSGPGSSARSARTSRGSRRPRSGSIGRPRGPPAGPAWRSRPTRVLSAVGLAQLRIFEEEGADPGRVVIGHADSYPNLDHYLAIVERGANVEFDFLGMASRRRAARRRPGRRAPAASSWRAATPTGSCSARTSATTRSSRATRATATSTCADRSCRGSATAGVSDAEIETMTVANPRRLLTIG